MDRSSESPRSSGSGTPEAMPQLVLDASTVVSSATDLRDAVCSFVRQARSVGQPPERVLMAVKSAVRQAVLHAPARPDATTDAQLMQQSVEWCIAEYYRVD